MVSYHLPMRRIEDEDYAPKSAGQDEERRRAERVARAMVGHLRSFFKFEDDTVDTFLKQYVITGRTGVGLRGTSYQLTTGEKELK